MVEEEEGGRGRMIQECCWSVSEQGNGGGLADVDADVMCGWRERLVRVVKCSAREVVWAKDFKERRDETSKDDATRAN